MTKKKTPTQTAIAKMLDEVRAAVGRCTASEKDTYDALLAEADGWQMRMEELSTEPEDE